MRAFVPLSITLMLCGCYGAHRVDRWRFGEQDADTVDSGSPRDAGVDSGRLPDADVSADAGPVIVAPRPLFPWNGHYLGPRGTVSPTGDPVALTPRFVWVRDTNPDTFQIQITADCDVASMASCEFRTPEVDGTIPGVDRAWTPSAPLMAGATPPAGARYFWRLRACEGETCSAWSSVRYLNVGRGRNDYDGNGQPDVLGLEGGTGTVVGFASSVLDPGREWVIRDAAPSGPSSVLSPIGDVNGDGFPDLAVGAPSAADGTRLNVGFVAIYFGSSSGLSTSQMHVLPAPASGSFHQFGGSIAPAGDLNADGFDDVLVGLPTTPSSGLSMGGLVRVVLGAREPEDLEIREVGAPFPTVQAGFGSSVDGVGDVDGDGRLDIVVGAPDDRVGGSAQGRAYLLFGDGVGGFPRHAVLDCPLVGAGARCGHRVASLGDANADGLGDVAVSAPRASLDGHVAAGLVAVFMGRDGQPPESAPTAVLLPPEPQPSLEFGATVVNAGDIDADGDLDVAVGAPGYSTAFTRAGRAYVFANSGSTGYEVFSFGVSGVRNNEEIGRSLANGGVSSSGSSTGYPTLLLGQPGTDCESPDDGAGCVRRWARFDPGPRTFVSPVRTAGARMGFAIAGAR